MDYNQELSRVRSEIDRIDTHIYSFLKIRTMLTTEVGELKQKYGVVEMDRNRREEIYNRLEELAIQDNLPVALVKEVYDVIFKQSIIQQTEILNKL